MERLILIALLTGGCYSSGFLCGTTLDTDPSVIRRCTGNNEVCICATNSCATRDAACSSGLRYGPSPFISSDDLEGKCVPDSDAAGETLASGAFELCGRSVDFSATADLMSEADGAP